MGENPLPPAQPRVDHDDSDALNRVPIAGLSNSQINYPLETLEVKTEGQQSAVSPFTVKPADTGSTAAPRSLPFSRRRAVIISLCITMIIVFLTGGVLTVLMRGRMAEKEAAGRDVPTQGVSLTDGTPEGDALELKKEHPSLLVSGDIITRGELQVSSGGGYVSILKSQDLDANQTILMPAASGTLCLDSNNCGFATVEALAGVQNQIVEPTTVNGFNNNIIMQGTTYQVGVASANGVITLTTPQNIHTAANVQFAQLQLSGALRVSSIVPGTAGGQIAINAAGGEITFVDRGRTFAFPLGGLAAQTICTTQNNCNYGSGNGDIVNGGQIGPIVIGTDDASTLTFETNNTPRIVLQSNGNVAIDTTTLTVDAVNNRVGIGTATPSAKLHVNDGTLLVQGTHGGGNGITVTGAGTRMFFDVNKSAFRAGGAFGSEWDNLSIGQYSFATNYYTTAGGYAASALGYGTSASGQYTLATGYDTQSTGTATFSANYGTTARSFASSAFGYCNAFSGSQTTWVDTDQLFVIGNGVYNSGISDCSVRQNALEMTKNGNLAVDTDTLFVDAVNNRVGIGTVAPITKLHVKDGHFFVQGATELADPIPASAFYDGLGRGVRMFFDIDKAAFRAGFTQNNTSWSSSWVGTYSAAFGDNNRAGQWGFSAGQSNQAGTKAVAFGSGSIAGGWNSATFGDNTRARTRHATAIGVCNVDVGDVPVSAITATDILFAIGNGTADPGGSGTNCSSRSDAFTVLRTGNTTVNGGSLLVQGTHGGGNGISVTGAGTRMFFDVNKSAFRAGAVTTGYWNDANIGQYSFAAGQDVLAAGNSSVALGNGSRADWDRAIAIGFFARGNGIQTVSMGYYTQARAYASTALGICNAYSGSPNTWNATDQLFMIGNGTINGEGGVCTSNQNALEITKNGNLAVDTDTLFVDAVNNRVGIGTVAPTVALEVVGDGIFSDRLQVGSGFLVGTIDECQTIYGMFACDAALDVGNMSDGSILSYGGRMTNVVDAAASSAYDHFGLQSTLGLTGTESYTGQTASLQVLAASTTTGTVAHLQGGNFSVIVSDSSATVASALTVNVEAASAGNIGTAHGLHVTSAANGSATITNNYGIRVENQTAGTNNYGVYIAGADTYALWVDSGATRLDGTLQGYGHAAFGADAQIDGTALSGGGLVDTSNMRNVLTIAEDVTDFTGSTAGGIVSLIQASPTTAYAGGILGAMTDVTVGGGQSVGGIAGLGSVISTVDAVAAEKIVGNLNVINLNSSGDVSDEVMVSSNQLHASTAITGRITGTSMQLVAVGAGGGVTGGHYEMSVAGNAPHVHGIRVDNTVTSGTVTDQTGAVIALQSDAGATIATSVGLDVRGAAHGGTVTDSYGIRVGSQSGAANNYGVYIEGGGTYALWVDSGRTRFDGNVGINNTTAANTLNINMLIAADADAQLAVATGGTLNKGVIVQGVSGQAGDLFQAQDYTGAVLASISADGSLEVTNAIVNGTLVVNGNATINGHIISGNSAGTTTVVAGVAADCAATASVSLSGNDTAGTITITTGSGACSTGELASITFAQSYGAAPRVTITAKNADAAGLQFFNGSVSGTAFTIDTATVPAADTTYEYVYHVIQ